MNESRNIFLQLINKNFEDSPDNRKIISNGQTMKGVNYTNKGVVWITNYNNANENNAINPHVVGYDLKYKTTYYMIVSADGKIIKKET